GSGGGGTIAILAEGSITISGAVTARGGDIDLVAAGLSAPASTGGPGSGGSILLRSLQCLRVSGTIDATGGAWLPSTWQRRGATRSARTEVSRPAGAPALAGAAITRAPLVAALPFLTQLEPARIGQVYRARCASAPGDVVGWYVSPGIGVTPLPPFGTL